MSADVNLLFISLEQLRLSLENSWEKAVEAAERAAELSGEWEQEIATDMDGYVVRISDLIDDLDDIIEEGKSLWEDWELHEGALRATGGDEERGKWDAEHIQEEMREDRERKHRE